jgi:2,3-diketo-5-methylthio-1-phosphopentane phosphatase
LKLAVFTDYDGTITQKDTVDLILDTYGMPNWLEISKAIDRAGAKNIERMTAEFQNFRATRQMVRDLVRENVTIDETFRELVDAARKRGWKLVVLSQGLGDSVETIFDKYGITGIEWHANALEETDGTCMVTFPENDLIQDGECSTSCGVCKGGHIRQARREGYTVVYIGDGITDRCAAEHADIVFAKRYLKKYLTGKGLPFTPFEKFSEVVAEIERRFVLA